MTGSTSEDIYGRLAACRIAWAVEQADGPASRWPRLMPRPELAQFCLDRQGFGVPEESLPLPLAPYSVCGWKLAVRSGSLVLEAGSAEPVNEGGCRRHLESLGPVVEDAFLAWIDLQGALADMAGTAPSRHAEPAQQSQPVHQAPPARQTQPVRRDPPAQDREARPAGAKWRNALQSRGFSLSGNEPEDRAGARQSLQA